MCDYKCEHCSEILFNLFIYLFKINFKKPHFVGVKICAAFYFCDKIY